MVAVQSAEGAWPSPQLCGNARMRWDLRDPTPAVIAAAAQVVAGLLPPDTAVNGATELPAHDATWAVGEQPLAATAPGFGRWSGFHVDRAHRHALAWRLDGVLGAATSGIHRSVASRTVRQMKTSIR